MDTLAALAARKSSRSFSPREVPKDMVEKIIDAGRLAATARNEQPWDFVVVTDASVRKKIADITDHGKFIAQAPVCVAVFCKDTKYYLEDGSAATQNILVAAAALGVQSCWVAGDKKPYGVEIGRLLGVPLSHKLVSLIPLGYEHIPTPRAPKKTLQDVLHWGSY